MAGELDVRKIERELPASQFLEWMEYERLEPFGSWRDNWHSALLAQIVANAFRGSDRPPFHMHEFFYKDPETATEDRDAEFLAFLEARSKKE